MGGVVGWLESPTVLRCSNIHDKTAQSAQLYCNENSKRRRRLLLSLTFYFLLSPLHFPLSPPADCLHLPPFPCHFSPSFDALCGKNGEYNGGWTNCFEDCQIYEDCPGIVIIASWFVWSGGCASVFGASNNNYCIIRKCWRMHLDFWRRAMTSLYTHDLWQMPP